MSETARIELPVGSVVLPAAAASTLPKPRDWRKMAIEAGIRLDIAETQAKDLRIAADEARARFTKYKGRLDASQARVNELEVERIKLATENDELRAQLARQAEISRKVYEFRKSILEGPLWDLFVETSVSPAIEPGGEQKA